MDYGLPDNARVKIDPPLSQNQRFLGRGRGFLHRKSTSRSNGHFARTHIDMETKIHLIEQEAYTSVLRAFKAQSDAITWEKESLITELRKELQVSDDEHRKLLSRVNAEDIINEIREWRTMGELQPSKPNISQSSARGRRPGPTVSASSKKTKTSQSIASMSFEISPENIRWKGGDPGLIHGTGCSGPDHGLKKSVVRGTAFIGGGRGGKSIKGGSRTHVPASLNGSGRDSFGVIEILHTDTLIKEVEQVLSAIHPDPAEIEKVKKVLKDQEIALIDAIARLEDASDGESGNNCN